jgi:4-hydroxy-tetrahydrodipicolinate synthase
MFKGSIVALVTPFRDGAVDFEKLDELVDFHVQAGTHGIVPCGTTGESATLSHSEHEEIIARIVKAVDGRVPVIAGTGSNNTDEAERLTRFAGKAGADAALLITPYYNKPTQEGLYRHFKRIAESVDIAIVLYNVPSRTGVNLLPQTVLRLAELKNVVGIKEASGNTDQTVEILQGSDLAVLSGDDALTVPLMALGASGVISVAANLLPAEMADLVDRMEEGNITAAREIHFRLHNLFKALFLETNPIPVKTGLSRMGKITPEFRLPLCELAPENLGKLESVLAELDLIPA